jgi:hypothetical protein
MEKRALFYMQVKFSAYFTQLAPFTKSPQTTARLLHEGITEYLELPKTLLNILHAGWYRCDSRRPLASRQCCSRLSTYVLIVRPTMATAIHVSSIQ